MNSFPTFGTFVLLLFAYCTPTQGYFKVFDVSFETGERYGTGRGKTTALIATLHIKNGYAILETDDNAPEPETRNLASAVRPRTLKEFKIFGIDTIVGKDVVARTDNNKFVQMELLCGIDSQKLFTMVTGRKLGDAIYSYKLSVVDLYKGERPMNDVTISGFKYTSTSRESPQHRYIIHTGEAYDKDSELLLLWTEKNFNYYVFDNDKILLTVCRKPVHEYYEHYLVKFADKAEFDRWFATPGQLYTRDIPMAPKNVEDHFRRLVAKRTVTGYRFA